MFSFEWCWYQTRSEDWVTSGYRVQIQRGADLRALSRILGISLKLAKKYQLSLSGQLYGRYGEGSVSQCQDVTVTCQRDNVTNMITCHVSRRDNSITRQCSIRWWEGDEEGTITFMHLYRLGLARQPEPEDGQAWLRRRPGGTGCSIPCQCPASLRPGDTRYPEHRQQERHGRVQSSSVAFISGEKLTQWS